MDRDELRRLATLGKGYVGVFAEDLRSLLDALERAEADVSQLRDDRADLRERCNRLSAEKAEALRMLAEAEAAKEGSWIVQQLRDEARNELHALAASNAAAANAESRAEKADMSGQEILIEQLRAEVERVRERADQLADALKWGRVAFDERKRRLETAERERDEARANYAFMVERAADQKLDGYRELGARAAAAEERAERAERERDEWKRSAESQNRQWSAKYTEATELRARAKKAESERDALRHHYDKAGPEHNLLALLDMYDEWRVAAESERDEARAERDARPNISAYDAAIRWTETREGVAANARIEAALDAHAAKAVKP